MRAFEKFLSESQQRQLLRHMHLRRADPLARRDGAVLRLLLHTGMRLGETCRMSVGCALAALKTGWIFIPKEHRKGGKRDHTVRVTEPVREALRDLLGARAEITQREFMREDAPLLASRQGEGMSARAVQYMVKRRAVEAGLAATISPHWMRHTRGKNIMRRSTSNDPRGLVQAALGHASISSTGIYTEVSADELADALEEVDGLGDRRAVKRSLRRAFDGRASA